MKQASLNLNLSVRKARKQVFLEQRDKIVPWDELEQLVAPYYSEGIKGRPSFVLQTMLRTHFMQQGFNLADQPMEEALFDTPLYREFAQLTAFSRLPDESIILRFRHRLEPADQILAAINELFEQCGLLLKTDAAVDATLIAVPSSTKNKGKARDSEIHSGQAALIFLHFNQPVRKGRRFI